MIGTTIRRALVKVSRQAATRTVTPLRVTPRLVRNIHASVQRFGQGSTDPELASKLTEEITYETQNSQSEKLPEFITEFTKTSGWKIQDTAGQDEVTLTKQFGNEKISLVFAISEIDTSAEEAELDEESDSEPSYPIRVAMTITKPNGSITVDATAQEGEFTIDNISFFSDTRLAADTTVEADWKRRGLYMGPQFETLDESLQVKFEEWLAERGLNSELALFIPNYADHKDQKEYFNWLGNVKNFVEA